ncbi:hypothetical protein DM82_3215 [Burkholderia oklahomensis]|uniref:Uncharacterized protein n=1 Tax=Burkholderia oklahomensis TaxID=342113 RepID=A0AAI8FQ23_9BURK|nr:hypothetical protein DM82_3215 [Burkholderia oklahomensis]
MSRSTKKEAPPLRVYARHRSLRNPRTLVTAQPASGTFSQPPEALRQRFLHQTKRAFETNPNALVFSIARIAEPQPTRSRSSFADTASIRRRTYRTSARHVTRVSQMHKSSPRIPIGSIASP